jgi:putative endonuclease
MTKKKRIGSIGEIEANAFLIKEGYTILEQNWRFHHAEIDIIAKKNEALIFIEVKARTSDKFGKPEWLVKRQQQRLISNAAKAYMRKVNHEWIIRFDIIGILTNSNGKIIRLTHVKDAFFDP